MKVAKFLQTLFNSPRNSIDAHISLFKGQNCHTMIVPALQPLYVAPLLAAHPMRLLQLPKLEELLNSRALHYPYKKTFHEGYRDPLVSLHTSGTTGKCQFPHLWLYLLNQ